MHRSRRIREAQRGDVVLHFGSGPRKEPYFGHVSYGTCDNRLEVGERSGYPALHHHVYQKRSSVECGQAVDGRLQDL